METGEMKTQRKQNIRSIRYWLCVLIGTFLILVINGLLLGVAVTPVCAQGGEWKEAVESWRWSFPRDHGSHPDYRTEWWYFTGNLTDGEGGTYGYQLTFFRQGVVRSKSNPKNPWMLRDVYLAHFALTDIGRKKFWYAERVSREGPGLAHAKRGSMDVKTLKWTAFMKDSVIRLSARHGEMELVLRLTPQKPVVLHGKRGLSRKGPNSGQSSYYYSFTDLALKGSLKTPVSGKMIEVTGQGWFDQEFGSNQLTRTQVGWDWFGVHLSDGRDLMIYQLRKKDGSIEITSSGTLIEKNGVARHLSVEDFVVEKTGHWRSPKTKADYPAQWRIGIPSAQIDIALSASVPDQELVTSSSTGITYWEGAVRGTGTSMNRNISVEGYVELTGYAGALGGVF